tara:strand:- start:2173 stop:2691 length:519 start_codon:yes stop_codon:yes gene_type:complete
VSNDAYYAASLAASQELPTKEAVRAARVRFSTSPSEWARGEEAREAEASASQVIQGKPTYEQKEFGFAASRDNDAGRGRPSLIPEMAINRMAQRFAEGAAAHGDNNWRKGMPLSRFQDAIIRHAMAAGANDESEDHLAAILWNAAAWMDTQDGIRNCRLPASLDTTAHWSVS